MFASGDGHCCGHHSRRTARVAGQKPRRGAVLCPPPERATTASVRLTRGRLACAC